MIDDRAFVFEKRKEKRMLSPGPFPNENAHLQSREEAGGIKMLFLRSPRNEWGRNLKKEQEFLIVRACRLVLIVFL
jgi:hypothetical protein